MTDSPNRSELETLIEGAIARAIAAALPPFEQRIGARIDAVEQRMTGVMTGAQQMFRELGERMARLETRIDALTTVVGQQSARLVAVEVTLADIAGRVSRLSADITRGRTIDADRLGALEARLGALEARLATANDRS